MGADLYLNSVYQQNTDQYKPLFEEWVQRRDTLLARGKDEEAKAAQVKVEEYYDKMYERGYFRDSYNDSNMFWLFGLSWWDDVIPMLDDDGLLQVTEVQSLLDTLKEQESDFEENLHKKSTWEGWTKSDMETYFRDKYQRLRAFLEEAMTLNEAILCSL
jgi:hypothetical protein